MRHFSTFALLLILLHASVSAAASKEKNLDRWVSRVAIPKLVERLESHPRFQGETVRFVVTESGEQTTMTNSLALAVRDKIAQAVATETDIHIAWNIDSRTFNPLAEHQRVDCSDSDVHYYISIDFRFNDSGSATVSISALDLIEKKLISGFDISWRGSLTTSQYRAARQATTDPAYLGQRTVPFEFSQTDIAAAQLAHDVGCSLLRDMSGEYIATISEASDNFLGELTTLVTNNMAPYHAMQLAKSARAANSTLRASAHQIEHDLYQIWLTIEPDSDSSDLNTISASTYIYLPENFQPAIAASGMSPADLIAGSRFIDSISVVNLGRSDLCDGVDASRSRTVTYSTQLNRCFAVRAASNRDSVMFVLYHQLNYGLVRLGDEDCRRQTSARINRAGEAVVVPLAHDAGTSPTWILQDDWMLEPDADTYYVVAADDARVARALAKQIEQLPQRCGDSLRPGLDGPALRQWLRGLNAIFKQWDSAIDWQSLRVKQIY